MKEKNMNMLNQLQINLVKIAKLGIHLVNFALMLVELLHVNNVQYLY